MYLQDVHWEVPFPLTKEAVDNQAIVIPDRTGVYLIGTKGKEQKVHTGRDGIVTALNEYLVAGSHAMPQESLLPARKTA